MTITRRAMVAATIGGAAASAMSGTAMSEPAKEVPVVLPRTKLIDVHAHFIPDGYRAAAIAAGHAQPDGMPAIPPWSEAAMIETMDRIGVTSAILSVSSPGVHFGDDSAARSLAREVNAEGARIKAANPKRFGHFASVPLPDVGGALAEIAHAFDTLDADGVILESNSGGIYPGDPEFDPVFAELDRRGAIVLLHPTSPHCPCCTTRASNLPRPILEFMFETARAVTNLVLSGTLDRHPRLRMIVPHAGATMPVLADRVAMAASILPGMERITPASVMATLGRLYYDMAGAPVPRLLPALRTFADPDRLLYGSDWPFTPEPAVARLLAALEGFVAADGGLIENIRHRNAEALFPRLR